MTSAAVVLAAGGGTRFIASGATTHKLLAPLRGRMVVEWAIEAAGHAGMDELIVVTGAVAIPLPDTATHVQNRGWEEGQATSLAAAIARARLAGHDSIVVGLGDQPFLTPEAWRAVATATGPATPVSVATYGGSRGQPVGLHSSVWDELPDRGDEGARSLLRRPGVLVIEVPCTGSPADIDTLEDLARWS